MTIEETRQNVVNRLDTLRKVQFVKPTARDLRGPRHLIDRNQRKENLLYKQKVLKQQKDFQLKLAKIDKYSATLQAEEDRRSDLLASYERTVEPDYSAPVFHPIELVVPKPLVYIQREPFRKRKRIHQRRSLRNLRRVR